ncbi:MAG: hypothetical protein ABF296_04715, partial [Oceanococcaceae bacterium]
ASRWVLGEDAPDGKTGRQFLARPQWRAITEACRNRSGTDLMIRAFRLLKTLPVEAYPAAAMRTMAECAVQQHWPRMAAQFLAHAQSLDEHDARIHAIRLRLAFLQNRVGDYPALATLTLDHYSGVAALQAMHLKAMGLLARGDAASAVELLKTGPHRIRATDTRALEAVGNPSLFMRYNLALALLHLDHHSEALTILDALGQNPTNSTRSRHLIDLANLTLGHELLRRGFGDSAGPIFERIALTGPYSDSAILGLGWAYLANPGGRVRRAALSLSTDVIAESSPTVLRALYQSGELSCEEYRTAAQDHSVCRPAAFFRQIPALDPQQRRERAIRIWEHLQTLSVSRSVNAQAALALAGALADAGYLAWAQSLYESAILSVQTEIEVLERWMAGVTGPQSLRTKDIPAFIALWSQEAEPMLLMRLIEDHGSLALDGELREAHRSLDGDIWQHLRERLREHTDLLITRQKDELQQARFQYARLLDSNR